MTQGTLLRHVAIRLTLLLVLWGSLLGLPQGQAAPAFTLFESGQVRPLALSPSGRLLFATNTPDNRLEVFRIMRDGLMLLSSVPVGLEPVALAARSETEVWVVNHLSDSISVVHLDPDGAQGRNLFFGNTIDGFHNCAGCHVLEPQANPRSPAPGFFGTDGRYVFDFIPQHLKVPHLRNVYQKVGMFGMPRSFNFDVQPPDYDIYFDRGAQIRGFGILHDGAFDNAFTFFTTVGFDQNPDNPTGIPVGTAGDRMRRQLEAFVLAFDTNLAPSVGQQITLTPTHYAVAEARVQLLLARAEAGECEVMAKSHWRGRERGFSYVGHHQFQTDEAAHPFIALGLLTHVAAALDRELTFTCVPPGSGTRLGIDRDGDGSLDGDELNAGTDPADPASTP